MWVGLSVRVYMPGRSFTGSRPFKTVMLDSLYEFCMLMIYLWFQTALKPLKSANRPSEKEKQVSDGLKAEGVRVS